MQLEETEQLNELLIELNQSRLREAQLAGENKTILDAISSITSASNKSQIFEEVQRVLHEYIEFDDFVVIGRGHNDTDTFQTVLSTNAVFYDQTWCYEDKLKRVIDGDCIVLYKPNVLKEFSGLNAIVKDEIQSALLTGVNGKLSQSVILLVGRKKGQFDFYAKETLLRFRPLLERAVIDIEQKEQLESLIILRTNELELAQQKAIEANNAKSQFLAMMSHEIRTPLNAILGLIDVLKLDIEAKQHLTLLNQMGASAELLLVIINDILDVTKIESGHFDIDYKWIGLEVEVERALNYLKKTAEHKQLSFVIQIADIGINEYWVDPTRVAQIIFNLVGNAIKFTEKGEISVLMTSTETQLNIVVSDTGIGIEPALIDSLFNPFQQADSSITRNYGGTGLGLTITKHLIAQMNGSIDVKSEPSKGSIFTVSLPTKLRCPQAIDVMPQRTKKQINKGNVLVVEDTLTNQMVIKLILENQGYNVILLNNGKEVTEYFSEKELSKEESTVDIILMDLSMPVMDGLSATRVLRREGISIPIIALTAHVMEEDKQTCLDVGMNAFIAKPIRSIDIINTIEALL